MTFVMLLPMLTFRESLVGTLSFHTGLFHWWFQTEFALVTFLCQTSVTFFTSIFSFPTSTWANLAIICLICLNYPWTSLYVLSIYFSWFSYMRLKFGTKITPGVDFSDLDVYYIKKFYQDLSNEGSKNILSPLEDIKYIRFWQITRNQRFWILSTISEYGKIGNLLNSNLDYYWWFKNCLWHA